MAADKKRIMRAIERLTRYSCEQAEETGARMQDPEDHYPAITMLRQLICELHHGGPNAVSLITLPGLAQAALLEVYAAVPESALEKLEQDLDKNDAKKQARLTN
jgi:hypothetical protein